MKTLKLAALVLAGVFVATFTVVQVGNFESRRLRNQIAELERERSQLVDFAERLMASRRVAQVRVTRQVTGETGRPVNSLLWQEIGPSGVIGEPLTLEVIGRLAYFEALVIKFMHRHVGDGDVQRGASLVLFRRVFGDGQVPDSVVLLDRTPLAAAGESAETRALHGKLWDRFWDLVDDPREAARFGVRVAQIEAPAIPLRPGQVWEVALDAAGGLNVVRIADDQSLTRPQTVGR